MPLPLYQWDDIYEHLYERQFTLSEVERSLFLKLEERRETLQDERNIARIIRLATTPDEEALIRAILLGDAK